MSWLGLVHKGTEPLYSDEWNRVVDGLDILYGYVAGKLDRVELYYLKSDIIPDQDNVRVLGTEGRSWKEIQAHYGYFKDQVYVQGKAVIKDGDPIRIEEFIDEAKSDIDKLYGKLQEIASKIERKIAQLLDGSVITDTRLSKKIEEGYGFSASWRFENVPDGDFRDILFRNPSDSNRVANVLVVEISSFGQGFLDIYKNNTIIASGTKIEPWNLDLGSPNEAGAFPEYGGNYILGKQIHRDLVIGGTKIRAIGGVAELGEHTKIPPSYNILVRITNKTGAATSFSIEFKWFEDVLG